MASTASSSSSGSVGRRRGTFSRAALRDIFKMPASKKEHDEIPPAPPSASGPSGHGDLKLMSSPKDNYILHGVIGHGAFGSVYRGTDKRTYEDVAIKIIDIEHYSGDMNDLSAELSVLQQCGCEHITFYHGSYLVGTELWIVMEYLGGGSIKTLMRPYPFEDKHIAAVMRDVLQGLVYIHRLGKIHRDIKADNLLVSKDGVVKLGDFSISTSTSMANKRHSVIGTPYWMAPEVILNSGYDEKADIWSLGITAFEMAKGNPPHHRLNRVDVMNKISQGKPPSIGDRHSKLFQDFLALCLAKDPAKRPSAEQLLQHKFVKSVKKGNKLILGLIERKEAWKKDHPHEVSRNSSPDTSDSEGPNEGVAAWDFDGNTDDNDGDT